MKLSAHVQNSQGSHQVTLRAGDHEHALAIPPRPSGLGSSASGGELLFLALATCYCNDSYREAAKRGLPVLSVEVEAQGDFGAEGEPAQNVSYRARVTAQAPEETIRELMRYTDTVAEIQNTLRLGLAVALAEIEALSVPAGGSPR